MLFLVAIQLLFTLIVLTRFFGHLDMFVLLAIGLFSIAYTIGIIRPVRNRRFFVPLALGYALRVFLLFYDVYSSNPLHLPLVGGPLTSDPYRFYKAAVNYSQGLKTSYGGFFSVFLGKIFSLTGPSRLLAEFIVLLFSVGTILTLVRIVDELDAPMKSKKKGVYLMCLLPNYAFLSVILRRETIITFFIALSLMYFIRWFRGVSGEKAFALSVVFALLASLFHGATGLIIVSYLLIRVLYSPKLGSFTLETKNIVGAIFFFVIVMVIYMRYGTTFFGKIEQRIVAGSYSNVRDEGGSSYAQYVGDANSLGRALIYAIPRFLYYLFSPFPWQWRGFEDIATFLLSSCVYLFILVNSIRSLHVMDKQGENRKLLFALLIVALITAAVFSWGVSNTGTATRHRDKFLVLFAVMFVLSEHPKLRRK